MKRKKTVIAITLIVISVAVYYYFFHHRVVSFIPDAVVVEAIKVKKANVPIEAQAIGTLTAAKSVDITPEIPGHVAQVLFQDGAFVKQGEPLFQLDDTVAKAKWESAKANLFFSEKNYERMLILKKKGAVSQQAVDQALADLKEKKALSAESEVAVQKMRIVAPFNGRANKANVTTGDYVSLGEKLVTFVDTEHLRVEYSLSEKYLPLINLNQAVKVTSSAYPDKIFQATVSFISPIINNENRTITLYASLSNESDLLRSGLYVNITQILGTRRNALMIPAVSLVDTLNGQFVYKVLNNKVVYAPVKIGQQTIEQVEVLNGLSAQDVVVTAGQQKIKEGMSVTIRSKGLS